MRWYFEHHRGTNHVPSPRSPSRDNAVTPGTHVSLHSTSLNTPGTNDGPNKSSNDMESFIKQTRFFLEEKEDRIAELVADRDLLQTKVILHDRDAEYQRLHEARLDSRIRALEHYAVMRFMAEQTPQRASWTDEDRAVLATPTHTPGYSNSGSDIPRAHEPIACVIEASRPPPD